MGSALVDMQTPTRAGLPVVDDTPPKRRRLTGKQPPPSVGDEQPGEPFALAAAIPATAAAIAASGSRANYKRFHNAFVGWQAKKNRGPSASILLRDFRTSGLRNMSAQARHEAVAQWARSDDSVDANLKAWALEVYAQKAGAVDPDGTTWFLKTPAALLTWNGDWGQFTILELFGSCDVVVPLDEVCVKLKTHSRIVELQKAVHSLLEHLTGMYHIADHAYSLEVCTKSYETAVAVLQGQPGSLSPSVRVHAHVFLRAAGRISARSAEHFRLFRSLPVKSSYGNRGRANSGQGLYYVQCPKIGQVLSGGSLSPFQDYLVSGEWIMNLVQACKITYSSAREELIKSAKNLQRLLPGLEKWKKERDELQLQTQIAEVQAAIGKQKRPYKTVPAVVAWQQTFNVMKMRYKFLVLEGPSSLGKTQFSSSLSPSGRFLEIDCAGSLEPDMRLYDALQHDTVLFDEGSCALVLRCKKLFQASASMVNLASSGTNCHAYRVWVYKKQLVISTNRWSVELQMLPGADRDWLVQNSVHVLVTEPLWLEEAPQA